jgi:tRNA threonylcarbamoyladenosine modification (KEOPS) complex Cgi121 subunit
MLYHLKEYGKYAEITGYKNIKFAEAEELLKANRKETRENVDLQFFDAQLIATQEHLFFAALNALQAFKNKTNLSKSLAMETMLYASAQRQIQRAIQRLGIKPQTTNMAVVILSEDLKETETMLTWIKAVIGAVVDEKVLDMTGVKERKICHAFQITDEELETLKGNASSSEAVVNLVIERVALLATQL